MIYEAHNYQKYAKDFIVNNRVSAIFLDCGLGKTVITLDAINELKIKGQIGKVLVVAPLRPAISTWPSEINKWDFAKGFKYSLVIGTLKERLKALKENSDIYIINRENVDWLINKSGHRFDFDFVVLDELSSFKSWSAKRFKALLGVRNRINRIVGLTATPASNSLIDLWGEFRILDQGERLGKYKTHYIEKYFLPDKRNAQVIFSYKIKPFAEEEIYEKISDITISMKATDYLDMPKLVFNNVEVELDKKERNIYEELKREMIVSVNDADEIDAINAASLSSKLLQMSNGAVYDENKKAIDIHSKKLDALEDLIEFNNGRPVLICYWFKHDRDKIKSRFDVREILTDDDINDWNEGLIPIGIIQPASCSMGLNLQKGGSTLIWYSLCWSLEMYEQTNCRLYRQGQKNTVVIHHIITKDTIDESVIDALNKKELTQEALIDAVKAEVLR